MPSLRRASGRAVLRSIARITRSSTISTRLTACLLLALLSASSAAEDNGAAGGAPGEGLDWWSLRPLSAPRVPASRNPDWERNPIDAFVLERLESKGLAPAPEAGRSTLVRRLSYDVLGLPPTPELVRHFVADSSPAAYERLVDELLASPHYGERWGRHWLDVARYGESDGFEYDALRPNAWPYRDWVIAALNADMPYDEFARKQIAGDVIAPEDPAAPVATGFLVCGAYDGLRPSGDKMRAIMRQDELEDLVSTVGQAFLGLTVHCARCHDHKFDPIRQREYYQISAALAGVWRGERKFDPYVETRRALKEEVFGALEALERPVRLAAAREVSPAKPPEPIASWSFDGHALDSIGSLHGKLEGSARIRNGRLELDGKEGFVRTAPLQKDLGEKTLEVWVSPGESGEPHPSGGGVVSVQRSTGGRFDAVVFGSEGTVGPERSASTAWFAASSRKDFGGDFGAAAEKGEEDAGGAITHIAVVYHGDGTVRAYRNGLPYGLPLKTPEPLRFRKGRGQILFGLRNGKSANAEMMFRGSIYHANLYARALTPEEVRVSSAFYGLTATEVVARLEGAAREEHLRLQRRVPSAAAEMSSYAALRAYVVTPKAPPAVHVLERGSPFQPGEEVAAGGVASIQGPSSDFALSLQAPEGERRKALAEWIAADQNPLFARTLVNRLWHYHLGRGFVETPSDLGLSGGAPSHPELLEWLAIELRDGGFSLKRLHRLILTSATYRQSSRPNPQAARVDADNRLLWRVSPLRMQAEVLRDSLLQVAGRLNARMGGEGFQDFEVFKDRGTWSYPAADRDFPDVHRRSIYRTWARGAKSPLLEVFDCPDPSTSTPKRGVTTTPLGALTLLNNVFVLRMADSLAERLRADAGIDPVAQVTRAFELAFSRTPSAEEVELSTTFIASEGLEPWCRVVFNTNEFLYVH